MQKLTEINFAAAYSESCAAMALSEGIHSDKSSLDKPHFLICDEAAAEVLSEPPSSRVLMLFLMGADFGIFKKEIFAGKRAAAYPKLDAASKTCELPCLRSCVSNSAIRGGFRRKCSL